MSIATEITRLQTAKSNLKTAIEAKGVTVPSATTLDGYSALVASIPSGGGADLSTLDICIADFLTEPPTITNGALDGFHRVVKG